MRWPPLPFLLLAPWPVLASPALGRRRDPDEVKSTEQIVAEHGYPVERHEVVTDDGFILTAFRIPRGARASHGAAARPPVLLQHGLLCSSFDWVNNGPDQSLGFILADAGFDVWLGNNRGNTWGLNHTTLPVGSDEFWNFTWDEMALFDLPALVQRALNVTGAPSLSLVGHSEGTTQAFAGFSRIPALAASVGFFAALAPAVFVSHQSSPVFTALSSLRTFELLRRLGGRRFLPSGSVLSRLAPGLCTLAPGACDEFIFLFCGRSRQTNVTRLPVYLSHTPAGTSVKNMVDWAQQVRSGTFSMFDYGTAEANVAKYGQPKAPAYDLSKMTVKTALFTGGNDILADPKDVQRLRAELPKGVMVHDRFVEDFAHLDFVWAENAHDLVYPELVGLLRRHSPGMREQLLMV